MYFLVCSKCGKPYGCRPHYHYPDNPMTVLCVKCPVAGVCDYYGCEMDDLMALNNLDMNGFCPDCIEKGGGL